MKTATSPLRLPPSPLRETSAATVYIFQLYALMEGKRRPGKDEKDLPAYLFLLFHLSQLYPVAKKARKAILQIWEQ